MVVKPFINKILEKGYGWFLKILNATDHSITKVTIFLQEKKKLMKEYLKDREELIVQIKNAQEEIEFLQNEINGVSTEHTQQLLSLYEKLEYRTQELFANQQELETLNKSIENTETRMTELSNEREKVIIERNFFRSEYDNLQAIIQQNIDKQEELKIEIESLKTNSNQEIEEITKQKINAHQKTIEKLKLENMGNTQSLKEIQSKLKNSMNQVVKLSSQLQEAEAEIKEKQNQIEELEQRTKEYEANIKSYTSQTKNLKEYINFNKKKIEGNKQRIAQLNKRKNELEKELKEITILYETDLEKAEEEINELKDKLLKEQNNLAMEIERNGAPAEISDEAIRILEQEYEPRFSTLYQDCIIQKEFYHDFFTLIPSDRLRIEACIVNLNHHFQQSMSNVRPNTVKTERGTTLNEYPFGQDGIGRIYFKKDKGKVTFYRISRTKNGKGKLDQDRVIAWLKKNC